MPLQTVRAVYKDGGLTFADPGLVPEDGTAVVVTFLAPSPRTAPVTDDPLQALRGRG